MQATLQQLEQLGAVERRTLPGRGRTAQLHVTPTGSELLSRGQRAVRDADRVLLDDVPAEQREALTASLLSASPPPPPAAGPRFGSGVDPAPRRSYGC